MPGGVRGRGCKAPAYSIIVLIFFYLTYYLISHTA